MSFAFWGLAIAMSIAAIGIVAIPRFSGKPRFSAATLLPSVLIPLIALGIYSQLGSPDALSVNGSRADRSQVGTNSSNGSKSNKGTASVASLVDGLKERLEQEPNDADGWILLARSYEHIGRRAEAVAAYDNAKSLGKTDPTLDASLSGETPAQEQPVLAAGPSLRGRVALAPDVAAQVQPSDTVFIFAKETAAQRMPVLALRKSASDLPLDFVLTDAQAMVPGTHVADYDQLVVTARISRSGMAGDAFNGLEVTSNPVSTLAGDEILLLIESNSAGDLPQGGPNDE
jgi:cytochrome c-type biogenesis protein CcmH